MDHAISFENRNSMTMQRVYFQQDARLAVGYFPPQFVLQLYKVEALE